MERRDRSALLARKGDAVAHQRTGDAAAAPGRMHRDRGDRLRRDRPAAEELADRQEHVPTDDLAVDDREPERRVGRGGRKPAHVGRRVSGERLGVDLGEATEVGVTAAVANLDVASGRRSHERPSVLAARAPAPARALGFGLGADFGIPFVPWTRSPPLSSLIRAISTSTTTPAVEARWRRIWDERGDYRTQLDEPDRPFYNLMMFPYPSAEGLHVGHIIPFAGGDIYGRWRRLMGDTVFEPMGFDAFGIHSENYAMKIGEHPAVVMRRAVANFRENQLARIGSMFDWSHQVNTADPSYYRWTQWLFVRLFNAGLIEWREGAVQLVPVVPHRARRRAGGAGSLRALPHAWCRRATSASGGSRSRATRRNCSTRSTRSTGRSRPRRCSATGSGAARARPSSSTSTAAGARTSPCSPRARTRSSAPPSW